MSLLPLAAAALLAQTPAPDALTPQGPATFRATFLGPLPAVMLGPRVIVRWRVRVGEGGAPGDVALRVLRRDPNAPTTVAYGRSAVAPLPAAPGEYEFPARLRISDGQELGLDQETGGHAIVATQVPEEFAVDAWRPPLGVGVERGGFERTRGARLLVSATTESDVDRDGHGDRTQDENDLAIAARAGRRAVRVILRNRGDRPVDLPHVLVRMRGARLRNRGLDHQPGYRAVAVRGPIPAGGARSVLLHASRRGFRVKLIAGSEGFDPTRAAVVVRGR